MLRGKVEHKTTLNNLDQLLESLSLIPSRVKNQLLLIIGYKVTEYSPFFVPLHPDLIFSM